MNEISKMKRVVLAFGTRPEATKGTAKVARFPVEEISNTENPNDLGATLSGLEGKK